MVFFGTVSCEIILDIGDGEIDFDGLVLAGFEHNVTSQENSDDVEKSSLFFDFEVLDTMLEKQLLNTLTL